MLLSPLYHYHVETGANFLEWGGWRLPGYFTSVADELCCVRTRVGYTEIPVLYPFLIRGPQALPTLQKICSRNLENCPPSKAVYSLILNEDGGIVEDVILYRLADDVFIMSVACKNPLLQPAPLNFMELKEPKPWLHSFPEAHTCIQFLGAFLVSVQGPRSRDMLRPAINLDALAPFSVEETRFRDIPVIVSRTGYSGELGFEFLVWPEHAPSLWESIIELGGPHEALPYGMHTTLIMGIEKGYLNIWDFYTGSTPLELGLAWAVDLKKPDFIGRAAVLRRQQEGVRTRLVGLELAPDAPTPCYGDSLLVGGKPLGKITNAGISPRLARTIARAWLPAEVATSASEAEVMTNGILSRASVCQHYCWYDPTGLRLRT